jgi:hypothetical protein
MSTPAIVRHSLAALLLIGAGAAQAQVPCGTWNPVALPAAPGNGLASVSASSATDMWAVWKAVYHWDGASWTIVPAPGIGHPDPLGYADTTLSDVVAISPGDAWIVGNRAFLGSPQMLAEHWNGSSWTVVPSPTITGGSGFNAVAAINANDVWAVGYRAGGLPEFQAVTVTLTAHWNGSTWTAVPSPNISNRTHALLSVAAIATNDVWAVGYYRNMGELYQTLILHWNGSSWSITPSPNFPGAENQLFGVSGTSANDVWAVGGAWDGVVNTQIFLHWDGSAWSQVTGPGGPTACVGCSGDVLAMGPNDVWAVGNTIGHWDGTQWTLSPNPEVPGATSGITMRALAKIGACDAWTVGSAFDANFADNALSIHLTAGGGTVNQPPVAVASASPASGPGPLEVHFSSAGSVDPDGSIVAYRWNFGDSTYPPNQTEANPVHTYVQSGPLTYNVSFQVEDNQGAITESSVQVVITPPVHVQEQNVVQAGTAGAWYGQDVIAIADQNLLPVADATVTVHHTGPTGGILTGTTGLDGRVTLVTPSTLDTTLAWCFTVTKVEKDGFVYAPTSNVVTAQCEGAGVVSVEGWGGQLTLRISPNPSRGESVIGLTLPTAQTVRLTIHDLSGRLVREIFTAPLPAGEHAFRWDGLDAAGGTVRTGVYFVTARATDRTITTRALRIQ